MRYSKLELFGEGYHSTLYCLVWRHHVGVPQRGNNIAAGNQWKHLEFNLALAKHFSLCETWNIRMVTSLNIWVIQNSKTQGKSMFSCTSHVLRSNPDVTQSNKKMNFKLLHFQNKACYGAENRPTDISLKCLLLDKGKSSKFLILVFFWRQVKTKNCLATFLFGFDIRNS